jgi:hypothetical protein
MTFPIILLPINFFFKQPSESDILIVSLFGVVIAMISHSLRHISRLELIVLNAACIIDKTGKDAF